MCFWKASWKRYFRNVNSESFLINCIPGRRECGDINRDSNLLMHLPYRKGDTPTFLVVP